jgi:RsmE family RNA methyltransferase
LNLLLFSDDDRGADNTIVVRDRRLQHLQQVTRSTVGDTLRVGAIGGLMGEGQILAISDTQATLAVSLDQQPPAKLPLRLVLALPRPKMLRRILRSVAEFGVAELHLINSFRVEKSYWRSPVLDAAQTREYLLQGLEQARDTVLPAVHCHPLFKPCAEDVVPALATDTDALLAQPGDYPPCPYYFSGRTLLVIGPEGGFIPYEVDLLQRAGCRAVSLGPRILRVENAVSGLLGKLL